MDYILKSDFLPLQPKAYKKSSNLQQYYWAQKKRIQKEKEQHQALIQQWHDIVQEESLQAKKKQIKSIKNKQKTNSNDQGQLKGEESSTRNNIDLQEMYNKNLQWKQGIDQKLQKLRAFQKQQNQKKQLAELSFIIPQRNTSNSILISNDYKGPIKGWKQRFDTYLKNKNTQLTEQQMRYFHPEINKISKEMVQKKKVSGQRVQDRLIQYGQKMKEKKIQLLNHQDESLGINRKSQLSGKDQSSDLACNNVSERVTSVGEVHERLFKDSERIIKKRNQYKSQHTFKPEINKNSSVIAQKSQKRKPLHTLTVGSKNQQQLKDAQMQYKQKQKSENTYVSRQQKQKNFSNFLKRNQALLSKIQKNRKETQEQIRQKQNKFLKECTFKPEINQRSSKIAAKIIPNQNKIYNKNLQMKNNEFQRLNDKQKDSKQINEFSQIQNKSENNCIFFNKYFLKDQFLNLDSNCSKNLTNFNAKQSKISHQPIQRKQISRLNSHGNIHPQKQSQLFIRQQDSISNVHVYSIGFKNNEILQEAQVQSLWDESNSRTKSRKQIESKFRDSGYGQKQEMFSYDEFNNKKSQIYDINQVIEDDSIEKGRDDDWEKELMNMERQIQDMMLRTPTK